MGHAVLITLSQDGFRGRNDDGSETTATWIAPIDTLWTQELGTTFRLRFLISRLAESDNGTQSLGLFESYNEGSFLFVSTTTDSKTKPAATSNFDDQDDSTQQLGSATYAQSDNNCMGEGGSFARGGSFTWTGNAGAVTEMEVEYCLTIPPGLVSNGDTIEYRVRKTQLAFTGSYNSVPILVIRKESHRIQGGTISLRGGTIAVR